MHVADSQLFLELSALPLELHDLHVDSRGLGGRGDGKAVLVGKGIVGALGLNLVVAVLLQL